MTSIQWTDETWNPVTGCTRVSEGCRHCYIERTPPFRMAGRRFVNGTTGVILHPDRLDQPLHWKKPRRVFVNSLSDLFHPDIPAHFIVELFEVMAACPQHTFQILTKRPERIKSVLYGEPGRWYLGDGDWPANIWVGFSAEDQATFDRRRACFGAWAYAINLWCSLEPLLGPITLVFRTDQAGRNVTDLPGLWDGLDTRIRWVVIGGESGPGARPCSVDWIRSIKQQCQELGIPLFIKQLGAKPMEPGCEPGHVWIGRHPSRLHCIQDLKGGNPAEWPDDLRIRQYP